MPKIIRNYYFEKDKLIIPDLKGIFDDMPTAYCDYGKEYKDPVLLNLENGQSVILEKEDIEKLKQQQEEKKKREEVLSTNKDKEVK